EGERGGNKHARAGVLVDLVVSGRPRSARCVMGAARPVTAEPAIPVPPMAARPLPPTPPEDGEPFTDVDALDVVSADVAAKIKAAAGFVPGVDVARLSAPTVAAQPLRDTP